MSCEPDLSHLETCAALEFQPETLLEIGNFRGRVFANRLSRIMRCLGN